MDFDEAKQWLEALGLTMPDFMLWAMLDSVEALDGCLNAAGYPDHVKTLITAHLLTLLALGQSMRYMSSASSPSGASIGYRYTDGPIVFRNTLALLRSLDTAGCTAGMVPDLYDSPKAGLWVASGRCMRGNKS